MLACLDGVLLGRKAKGIVSHRVQDVESLEALVSGENVTCNISQGVAYVKARSGRIREHIQDIEFRFGFVHDGFEGLL